MFALAFESLAVVAEHEFVAHGLVKMRVFAALDHFEVECGIEQIEFFFGCVFRLALNDDESAVGNLGIVASDARRIEESLACEHRFSCKTDGKRGLRGAKLHGSEFVLDVYRHARALSVCGCRYGCKTARNAFDFAFFIDRRNAFVVGLPRNVRQNGFVGHIRPYGRKFERMLAHCQNVAVLAVFVKLFVVYYDFVRAALFYFEILAVYAQNRLVCG